MLTLSRIAIALVLAATALSPAVSAKSWCAYPLWVHEWGVNVFGPDGRPVSAGPLPAFFHTDEAKNASPPPVRSLPADSGNRALPVLHFYSATGRTIPIGIEVGFSAGSAVAWYPDVDKRTDAATANSAAADEVRARLVALRNKRTHPQHLPFAPQPLLGADPTAQLIWDRLDLSPTPAKPATKTDAGWVKTARGFDRALWVNSPTESERFVFYEGSTAETVPLKITRATNYTPKSRAYLITNTGPRPVHDLILTHREGGAVYVVPVPTVAPGATKTFVLESHRASDVSAASRGRLRDALIDKTQPGAPAERNGRGHDGCVMQRDPAIPFEKVASHRLYSHEVDLIVSTWGARFFDAPGTTIVYREDAATLTAMLPLSIYTDMHNYVVLHRAGLALWQGVELP